MTKCASCGERLGKGDSDDLRPTLLPGVKVHRFGCTSRVDRAAGQLGGFGGFVDGVGDAIELLYSQEEEIERLRERLGE